MNGVSPIRPILFRNGIVGTEQEVCFRADGHAEARDSLYCYEARMRGRHVDIPVKWNALLKELDLKIPEDRTISIYVTRQAAVLQAKHCQQPGRFADIPLYGMKAIRAVGEVCRTQVLASRQ